MRVKNVSKLVTGVLSLLMIGNMSFAAEPGPSIQSVELRIGIKCIDAVANFTVQKDGFSAVLNDQTIADIKKVCDLQKFAAMTDSIRDLQARIVRTRALIIEAASEKKENAEVVAMIPNNLAKTLAILGAIPGAPAVINAWKFVRMHNAEMAWVYSRSTNRPPFEDGALTKQGRVVLKFGAATIAIELIAAGIDTLKDRAEMQVRIRTMDLANFNAQLQIQEAQLQVLSSKVMQLRAALAK